MSSRELSQGCSDDLLEEYDVNLTSRRRSTSPLEERPLSDDRARSDLSDGLTVDRDGQYPIE